MIPRRPGTEISRHQLLSSAPLFPKYEVITREVVTQPQVAGPGITADMVLGQDNRKTFRNTTDKGQDRFRFNHRALGQDNSIASRKTTDIGH